MTFFQENQKKSRQVLKTEKPEKKNEKRSMVAFRREEQWGEEVRQFGDIRGNRKLPEKKGNGFKADNSVFSTRSAAVEPFFNDNGWVIGSDIGEKRVGCQVPVRGVVGH